MPYLAPHLKKIDLGLTPEEVGRRCSRLPGFVFFDSALDSATNSQVSIIAARPEKIVRGNVHANLDSLRAELDARAQSLAPDCGIPLGFAAGWIEYDGEFSFGIYENLLAFRIQDQTWYSWGDGFEDWLKEPEAGTECGSLDFRSETTPAEFCRRVRQAKDYISAGDIYQVNLAHRFTSEWRGDAWSFYEALRHYSPASYASFIALYERTVLSSSPECFLKMTGRHIRTRPIKGTRPRMSDGDADQKSAYDLITSPKEIAELVMITDLARNDLGRVCDYGAVEVTDMLKLEKFEQVYHLVSTVEGELRAEVDHPAALAACFPGGSITGAPKKRAMEIIAELEPQSRGLYTGALGYFGFNGESQFSMAIRTVVLEKSRAHFHVGAGIVADSIPEAEYQETLDKAAGILLAAERIKSR